MKEDITPYTNIPNKLLDNEELTSQEKLVFITIISYYNKQKGYAYPSYADLKRRSSLKDTRTLNKAVNGLIEKNFIRKETLSGVGCRYFLGKKTIDLSSTTCKITPGGELHQVENYTTCKITPGGSGELHQEVVENYTTTNTNTITKKNNNIYSDIISYLNEKTGRTGKSKFNPKTKDTIKRINGRIKEGATIEDFKIVIDNQCSQWLGTSLAKYLTPDTLFSPSKFEKYLKSIEPVKEKITVSDRYID